MTALLLLTVIFWPIEHAQADFPAAVVVALDPVVQYSLQGAFALLFMLAAQGKWRGRLLFSRQLDAYQMLPSRWVPPAMYGLVVAEGITALLLLSPAYIWGAWLGGTLLLVYALAISINLARGRAFIDCGCSMFQESGEGLSAWLVWRNCLLALLCTSLYLPVAPRTLVWLDAVGVGCLLLSAGLLYVIVNTLINNDIHTRLYWQQQTHQDDTTP